MCLGVFEVEFLHDCSALTWPDSPCRTRWWCRDSVRRCRPHPRRSCPRWRCSIRWWEGGPSGGRSKGHGHQCRSQESSRRRRSLGRAATCPGWGRRVREVSTGNANMLQYRRPCAQLETAGLASCSNKCYDVITRLHCTEASQREKVNVCIYSQNVGIFWSKDINWLAPLTCLSGPPSVPPPDWWTWRAERQALSEHKYTNTHTCTHTLSGSYLKEEHSCNTFTRWHQSFSTTASENCPCHLRPAKSAPPWLSQGQISLTNCLQVQVVPFQQCHTLSFRHLRLNRKLSSPLLRTRPQGNIICENGKVVSGESSHMIWRWLTCDSSREEQCHVGLQGCRRKPATCWDIGHNRAPGLSLMQSM